LAVIRFEMAISASGKTAVIGTSRQCAEFLQWRAKRAFIWFAQRYTLTWIGRLRFASR
jgi:hypothetical protein